MVQRGMDGVQGVESLRLAHAGRTVRLIRMKALAALLLLAGLLSAGPAFGQSACTLTANEIPSLAVTRGQTNVTIIDTNLTSVQNAIVASCGGTAFQAQNGFSLGDDSSGSFSGTLLPATVTLAGGNGSFSLAASGSGRLLTYTPPSSGTGTQVITISQALATAPNASNYRFRRGGQLVASQWITVQVTVTGGAPDAPTASIGLSPTSIIAGGTSAATITLTNPNAGTALTGVANTITLPSGVTLASAPAASQCGGTVSGTAGSDTVTLTGGSLAASANCALSFNVTSASPSAYAIPSGTPSATGAAAGVAGPSANLTVTATPSAPTIGAAFTPTAISTSGISTLTLTITNPNGATQLTGVAVAAAALPANLTGSSPGTTCTSGTATYNGGSRTLSLSGATVNGGSTCTVTLSVSSTTPGSYSYTSGVASASGPAAVSGTTATTPTPLTISAPPTISAAFGAASVTTSGGTTLTITLTNPAGNGALTGVGFAPSSLSGLNASIGTNTCGGTASLTGGNISLSSGALAAGATCAVTLNNVGSNTPNSYTFTPGAPSATSPAVTGAAGSPVSLTVNGDPLLNVTLGVAGTPAQGGSFTLALNVGNTGSGPTSAILSLTSTLPTGFSFVSSSGAGWVCTISNGVTLDCAFSTPIAAGGGTSALTMTVAVAATAPASVSPSFSVSGGGAATPATGSTTVTIAQVPTAVFATSGDLQSATVGTTFAAPLSVTVRDAGNAVIPGASVTFTAPGAGASGTFAATGTGSQTVSANGSGVATSSAFTANGTPGAYTVSAAAGSVSTGFSLANSPSALNATQAIASASLTVNAAATPFTPVTGSGGFGTLSYGVAPALPAGLTLSTTTGQITGTPATTLTATTFTVTVTDSTPGTPQTASNTFQLTVARANQTTSFTSTPPGPAVVGAPAYTVTATATSGLNVTFTLDGASTGCALAGASVTFTGIGTCIVNANQAGDPIWNPAPQAQQSFAVSAAALTITPGAPSGTAVGNSYAQANTASGGVAPYTYNLASGALPAGTSLNSATGSVSGTPTIAGPFSYAIGVADSQATPATASTPTIAGTIAQSGQTISFTSTPPPSPVAGGPTYTVSATATSGLAVTFALDGASAGCTLAGAVVSFTGAGTCRINANQPGDGNVAAAPQVQQSFAIGAATVTVTPGTPSGATVGAAYNQANPASGGVAPYVYALASGALPAGTSLNTATGLVNGTPTAAGPFSYAINATDSQSTPVVATGAIVSGTIGQSGQTIAFTSTPPAAPAVGAGPYAVSANATSGLAVVFSLDPSSTGCALAGTSVTFPAAGTCRINANQPGDANIAAAPQVQQAFAVGRGDQAITFAPLPDVSQTASPITLSASASSGLAVTFSTSTAGVCTVAGTTLTLNGSGTCTVAADQAGDANWSAAPTVSRSFTVTPPPTTLSVTLTHVGDAVQGQNLAYTVTPSATGGPTAGTLTATFTLPAGISYGGASGTGWTCSGSGASASCTSTTVIAAGTSGPVITLTAAFAANAGSPLTPSVTLAGGGAGNTASASDPTVVRAPAPIAGPFAANIAYQTATPIDLTGAISGGPSTSIAATNGTNGTSSVAGNVVTYTPATGFSGTDSFTYTATGPGGTSAPGTVTVTVAPPPTPTAPAREVTVLAGRPIIVDLTTGATGGPFTAAAIVSTSPADAGEVRLIESGAAGNRSYSLEFTSRGLFSGAARVTYTLSNGGGTSQPLLVTVNVTARPDPSRDPEVRGIEVAETAAVRRFAQGQIRNFTRRLEQLHGEGGGTGNSFGITLTPGISMQSVDQRRSLAEAHDPTLLERPIGREATLAGMLGGASGLGGMNTGGGADNYGAVEGDVGSTGAPAIANAVGAQPGPDGDTVSSAGRAVGSIALWANGQITIGRRDPETGVDELSISTSGLTGGADIRIASGATIGIGVGIGRDETDVGENGSQLTTGSWAIGAYGSFRPLEGAFIDVVAGLGGFDFDIDRFVTSTGTMAIGRRDADLIFGSVTAGIERQSRRLRWSLYGGLEASRAELGSYAEDGPLGFALVYDERTLESLSGLFGGRFRLEMMEGETLLIPRGRFEYRYDFEQAAGQRVRFGDWPGGPSYLIDADGWSRSRISIEFGLGVRLRDGWTFGSDVLGDLSGNTRSIGLRIEIGREF